MPNTSDSSPTNLIQGRVLTDGDLPVPGVIVVALDYDARRVADLGGGVEAAIAAAGKTDDEHQQLQRLGSVITDRDGGFTLVYHDDLFEEAASREGGVEPDIRPDIVLLVLAPDVAADDGRGRSLADRVLYYSLPVQFTSGRIESFAVRIPVARLVDFEVLAGDARPGLANVATLVQSMDLSGMVAEANLFDGLLPKLLNAGFSGDEMVELAPSNWKNFSATAKKLQAIPWLATATRARTGRVYLAPGELAKLGVDANGAGAVGGASIRFDQLLGLIGYAAGPYRNRDLLSQVEVRRALAALDAESPVPPKAPGGPAAAEATEASLRQSILGRLEEQSEALAREPGLGDPANDLSRIREIVEQLEQSSGIGNTAATHDIDLLQVAWEPVWAAAFDDGLVDKAKALYRATVDEQGDSVIPGVNFAKVENASDFKKVIKNIAEFAGPPKPTNDSEPIIVSVTFGEHARPSAPPANPVDKLAAVGKLAKELSAELAKPYSFEYFAPNSINYGILQTYRQSWSPVSYQVGRVVDSIPLTPSEIQTSRLQVTVKRRQKRNSRELSTFKRSDDETSIGRTEIEAMEKTAQAMTTQMSANGQFNIGVASIGSTATFGLNQNAESQRMHKSFAEISRKASQEVRRETEVQYEIELNDESVAETTRTLKNANDEMTITYVLYELERRYRVKSQLQAVQPVLLVAMPMPKPNEIDDSWLIEHAWVIRDALLDNDFDEALDLLEDNRSRDDLQLAVLRSAYDAAFAVKEKATFEYERLAQIASGQRAAVVGAGFTEGTVDQGTPLGQRIAIDIATGFVGEIFDVFGGDDDEEARAKAAREAAEKTLSYLERELSTAAEVRDRATATLAEASAAYSAALAMKAMVDQKILQLRLHVRGNLFHYLHEIWSRRDPDDLFFSLYDVEVPFMPPIDGQCKLRKPTPDELDDEVPGVVIEGKLYMVDIHPATVVPAEDKLPRKRLVEIADLDRPLGFKGNYAIFPLQQSALLTDFMTVGFLDGYYGVRDPAMDASYSAGDLLEYAKSVWNDPVAALDDEQKEALTKLITHAGMRNAGYESELVLPTGKVWMEALKGGQALLEPFKLAHRGLDVLKVEEEVRRERIENLRRIQRIGLADAELDDPDIERVTIVRGMGNGVVIDPND